MIIGSKWCDGELLYETSLLFNRSQFDFIMECVKTARVVAQDDEMSFSKCIEMFAGEFAATYGVLADDDGVVGAAGVLARRVAKYAASIGSDGFDALPDGSIIIQGDERHPNA